MTAPPLTTNTRTYPATREGVAEALDALGHSPDLVAARLFHAGYLGAPGESTDCPVAVYLHAVITPRWPVSTGHGTATVYVNGARLDVPLPGPVRAFIGAFDLGAYPFLHPDGYVDPEAPADPLTRSVPAPAGGVW
jgi:hypothetical protein